MRPRRGPQGRPAKARLRRGLGMAQVRPGQDQVGPRSPCAGALTQMVGRCFAYRQFHPPGLQRRPNSESVSCVPSPDWPKRQPQVWLQLPIWQPAGARSRGEPYREGRRDRSGPHESPGLATTQSRGGQGRVPPSGVLSLTDAFRKPWCWRCPSSVVPSVVWWPVFRAVSEAWLNGVCTGCRFQQGRPSRW